MKKQIISLIVSIAMGTALIPVSFAESSNVGTEEIETVAELNDIMTSESFEINIQTESPMDSDEYIDEENEEIDTEQFECVEPPADAEMEVSAATGTYYSEWGIWFDESTGTITDCDDDLSGNIILPNAINGIQITDIGPKAFQNCEGLTSITIPSTFNRSYDYETNNSGSFNSQYIDSPFYGCSNLKQVILAEGITEIPGGMFFRCSSIETIKLPEGITDIGAKAFQDCEGLTSITIPSTFNRSYKYSTNNFGVVHQWYIDSPFYGCSNLKQVILAEGITEIPGGMFFRCSSIETIKLPEGITDIGAKAFQDCDGLTSITIPSTFNRSYKYSTNNFGVVHQWYIDSPFYGCSNLKQVILKEGITEIPKGMFFRCYSIYNITIPISTLSIGENEFKDATNLVIHCYPYSSALYYAKEHDIPYVLLAYSDMINNSGSQNSSGNEYDESEVSAGNSLGIKFKPVKANSDTLHGPQINILGKSFSLFDIPIGASVKSPIGSVKYNTKTEKYQVIVGLLDKTTFNSDKENKLYEEIKEFTNYGGGPGTNLTLDKYKNIKDMLKKQNMDFGFSFNATPVGYFELDKNMNLTEGSIMYLLNMDMNFKQYIPSVPVVYVKVGFGLDMTGKFGIKVIETNSLSLMGSLNFDVAPYVGAGIGSAKYANLEAGAKLTLNANVDVGTDKSTNLEDIFTATATGSLYVKLKALSFINFENKWDFAKVELYPNFGEDLLISEILSYDDMVVMPRNYNDELSVFTANYDLSVMNVDNIQTKTIKTNIYPYSEPQLVQLEDGKELLVWVDNDNSRSDINCSVLKYSINNGSSWSEPADIYNNGTADFAPALVSTENGAALVWQKANIVLSDSASLNEMAQQMDLYYSEFDGSEWNDPIKITDNNSNYEFAPSIASDGNNTTIAWFENSENDCFAISGTNSIYKKTNEDNWSQADMISSDLGCINSVGVAYIDGKAAIAYTVDMDGNVETSEDTELFEYYDGEIMRMTDDSVIDYALCMNSNGYAWVHNNQLWERTSTGVNLIDVPVSPVYLNNAKIFTNDSAKVIVWEQSKDYSSDLYAMYYDDSEGVWGEPIRLTEDNLKIRETNGYMTFDGNIRLAFGQAEVNENSDEIYGKCNLMVSDIIAQKDIAVLSADYLYSDYKAGEEIIISATVKNNSASKISAFDVTVSCNGNIVVETNIEHEIDSGATEQIEIPYVLPQELCYSTYTVTITPSNEEDINFDNNSASFETGLADLETTSTINGNVINSTIINRGYLTAENVICTLSSPDGTIIEEKKLDAIPAGDEEKVEFTVQNMTNVIVKVTTDSEENIYSNNYVALTLSESENSGVYIALGDYSIDNNGEITANATVVNDSNTDEPSIVVIALYKDDILQTLKTTDINIAANCSEMITNQFDAEADTIKIFAWNGMMNMTPFGECISMKVADDE